MATSTSYIGLVGNFFCFLVIFCFFFGYLATSTLATLFFLCIDTCDVLTFFSLKILIEVWLDFVCCWLFLFGWLVRFGLDWFGSALVWFALFLFGLSFFLLMLVWFGYVRFVFV